MAQFSAASGRTLTAMILVCACLGAAPVRADVITVDWEVVPDGHGFDPTPYYHCVLVDRGCSYLWEQGIELYRVVHSFYTDKWFDGTGVGVFESEIPGVAPGTAGEGIRPRCEPELASCFDQFTPLHLELAGHWLTGGAPSLFIVSSRGGLVKLPFQDGSTSVIFAGSEWERLDWLRVGFYLPVACEADVPPEELPCSFSAIKALEVKSLTFEPVPEPAMVALLGIGLLGLSGRRVRRLRARS